MRRWVGVLIAGAALAVVFAAIQMLFFGMQLTVVVSVALAFWFGWVDREIAR